MFRRLCELDAGVVHHAEEDGLHRVFGVGVVTGDTEGCAEDSGRVFFVEFLESWRQRQYDWSRC